MYCGLDMRPVYKYCYLMSSVSISKLKQNPSKAIEASNEYPIAIQNRNQTEAYLVGKDLYEKLVVMLEDSVDSQAVKRTDFTQGTDFEELANELGI